MRQTSAALAILLAVAAVPAIAQETPAPDQPSDSLSMGEPVSPDGAALGTPYVMEEHGDWDIRCIRTETGNDPCQLYQLLDDEQGNAVAEFAVFPLVPPQGEAIAGGTIVSPLETLLTQAVTLVVDGGEARRYPFAFCTEVGCIARVGYTAAEIDAFKSGSSASVTIVPVVAPDRRITLTVSLAGFTAGYDALNAMIASQEGAAEGGN